MGPSSWIPKKYLQKYTKTAVGNKMPYTQDKF